MLLENVLIVNLQSIHNPVSVTVILLRNKVISLILYPITLCLAYFVYVANVISVTYLNKKKT